MTNAATLRAPHRAAAKVAAIQGQQVVRDLYCAFIDFNKEHFGGRLASPLILVAATSSSRTVGDYIERDHNGLESRIRIAPRALKRGERFVMDVLLHEMVHAWAYEIAQQTEDGYRGHGPVFAGKCNEIGRALGLPEVGVKGRGGLPACTHWPHNVRPAGYYPEEFKKPTRAPSGGDEAGEGGDGADDEQGEATDERAVMQAILANLAKLSNEALADLETWIEQERDRRDGYADAAE